MSTEFALPTDEALLAALDGLARDGRPRPVALLARQPNPTISTFASEIVGVRLADGSAAQLFCKYADTDYETHGHRGGPEREVLAYRRVLARLPVSRAACWGAWREARTGRLCLVVEYLAGAERLSKAPAPALLAAATWLGGFHAASELLSPADLVGLPRYGHEYYLGWADRAAPLATYPGCPASVAAVLASYRRLAVPRLKSAPSVVIHGEYYPGNVLVRASTVYPVDWESVAVAAGELDLASLLEGWDADTARQATSAYAAARWPSGSPPAFAGRLAAAALYWPVRWLSEFDRWAGGAGERRVLAAAEAAAEWVEGMR